MSPTSIYLRNPSFVTLPTSPFIKPGTVSTVDYNHDSLLRSVEQIFGLSYLGDAAMPQVRSFGPDVYTRP